MRLRVYRSLAGPAGRRRRRRSRCPEAVLAGLRPPPGQGPAFDGAVLTLDQLLATAEAMGWASSSPLAAGGPLHGVRLICQLEPRASGEATDQLRRLADFLGAAAGGEGGSGGRPVLDLVVVRSAPARAAGDLLEYLAAEALPAAAAFLEAVPPGSVGGGGQGGGARNAHGGPVGRHVMGVAHQLPGLGLPGLAEVADVLPPTRLLLDPASLWGGEEEEGGGGKEGGEGMPPPSQSDALGLSRELESIVLGTDVIRATPSAFHPPGRSGAEGSVDYGLFGAGTLFGEVWCAQQLEGATETYVICDDDGEDEAADGDEEGDDGVSALAARIQAAFDGSATWRAGAGARREAEVREAASLLATGARWGQHHSEEVTKAARALGLATHLARDRDEGDVRLTAAAVKQRWRSLAFQSHPDIAGADGRPKFVALRQHYLTLMEAVGQEEEVSRGATV